MSDHPDEPKFAALHARCRAAGANLMRGFDSNGAPVFIVARWLQFRELPTLLAVANWLELVAGKGRRANG